MRCSWTMRCANIVAVVSVLCSGLHVARAADWTYWGDNGPIHWPGICKTGTRQSPIDISKSNVVKDDLGILEFVRYDRSYLGSVTNNGHTVQVELPGSSLEIEGSDLPSVYAFEQMHFHWSSEHTLNGARYPLELHFVHHDKKYRNVSEAAKYENGIAVVAVLFELSPQSNEELDAIIEATKHVSAWVGRSTTPLRQKINPYRLLPKDRATYFRYDGSLTTPNCHESVMWFVFLQTVPVSKDQVNVFENIETSVGKLVYNYRPVQDQGNRIVYQSSMGYSGAKSYLHPNFAALSFSLFLLSTFYGRASAL